MIVEEPVVSYNNETFVDGSPYGARWNPNELAQLETVHEDSMPCFLSEDELDQEITLSMKSGNATSGEVNAVLKRWMH